MRQFFIIFFFQYIRYRTFELVFEVQAKHAFKILFISIKTILAFTVHAYYNLFNRQMRNANLKYCNFYIATYKMLEVVRIFKKKLTNSMMTRIEITKIDEVQYSLAFNSVHTYLKKSNKIP